jgi:hypothetical protein
MDEAPKELRWCVRTDHAGEVLPHDRASLRRDPSTKCAKCSTKPERNGTWEHTKACRATTVQVINGA